MEYFKYEYYGTSIVDSEPGGYISFVEKFYSE